MPQSFKLFWDGSISQFEDTTYSASNNKHFLNRLLEVRTETAGHKEPPVALIHGHETESCLRTTLRRIKIEQQEEIEAMKARAAAMADSDAEDQMEDLDESKEEMSTFEEDLENIADFIVTDATPFSTKLLQGVSIKAMFSFDEHRKKSAAEE